MNESPEVHKFGGSCLRDSSDLDKIAEVVFNMDGPIVVVVSAFWGTTDRLMRAAKEPRYAGRLVNDLASQHLRFAPSLPDSDLYLVFQKVLKGIEDSLDELAEDKPNPEAYNCLLASGERLSALVVAHALNTHGIDAHPVGAEDIGLHLNGINSASSVDLVKSKNMLDRKALNGIPIVTGWFGEGTDGNIALLSRGGSDHTATALAALLNAKRVVLWKDVMGIYPVNPRWGIQSAPIPYLGYGEAMDFASTDATILHPATVEPIYSLGVPIEIRHLHRYSATHSGTVIGPDIEDDTAIKGIACVPKVVSVDVDVQYIHNTATSLSEVLNTLQEAKIRICSYEATPTRWRFVIPQHEIHRCLQLLNQRYSEINHTYYAAMISFIGSAAAEHMRMNMTKVDWANDVIAARKGAPHFLTQRHDLSKLMEEMMSALSIGSK